MNHHIRQQFLEVAFSGSAEDGMALQRHLPELYHEKLLPAIEKAFDRAFPADQLIVIDRLEVDAGTIAFDLLDKDLPETLLRELANIIHQKGYGGTLSKEAELHGSKAIRTIPEHLAEVFIHFLKTGTLLWSFRLSDGKTLEDELAVAIHDWEGASTAKVLAQNIIQGLSFKNAAKRLSNEFTVNFRKQLLRYLSAEMAAAVDKIHKDLQEKAINIGIETHFTDRLLEVAFTYLSENKTPTASGFKSKFADKTGTKLPLEEVISKQNEETDDLSLPEPSIEKPGTINHAETVAESFYIDNAGLILLHPFLPRYFEALGIVSGKQLIYPDQALSLLHYLTTGNKTSPEYELVLPKILCGLPVFTPGQSKAEISEKELEESVALLKAVIHHWTALGTTSENGLREAFLQRPGKLSQKKDGDWLLQVESRTLDILLGQLPWSFNMIQLPWMERLLWVEWSY